MKAGNNGLAYASYDDKDWDIVQLPHDFVIERGVYDITVPSATGYLKKGIVWYRKSFDIPNDNLSKRLFLQFDGIYRNCEVWFNGLLLGRHLGGYMGFEYEFTQVAKFGEINTIAIKVDADEYEGWWYEGGGIYRDERLLTTNQIRISDKEIYAETVDIDIENKRATIDVHGAINCGIINMDKINLLIEIYSPTNKLLINSEQIISVDCFESAEFNISFNLTNIDLWSLENCNLYTLKLTIVDENEADTYLVKFGLRKIKYTSDNGFEMNNKTIKLKGVCGHDDFAGVGTALTKPIIKYKIQRLMDMGCNSYRCAHNPPPPQFLELCDEMGFLVIDETRLAGIDKEVMDDYIDLIKRDRNHPSVIAWSMGNEEMGIHKKLVGVNIFTKMMTIGKKHDSTRPFLYAINADSDRIVDFDRSHGMVQNPVGVNYFVPYDDDVFNSMHKMYSDLCIINTETTGIVSTREYMQPYDNTNYISEKGAKLTTWLDNDFIGKATCYGSCHPVWGMTPEVSWKVSADKPYVAGVFLWTGFDYRGEVFPFEWPANITFFGIIDLCGIAKDWYYYIKSNWTDEALLHILPNWNMNIKEGTQVKVWAFTNCDEVELYLNDIFISKQRCEKYGHIEWVIPYKKGKLEAIGYRDGIEIIRDTKITSKAPKSLVLTSNKEILFADNLDAAIVTAHLEDEDGNIVITSDYTVNFEFEGNCIFLGTGNGDNFSMEHDKLPQRKLFVGKCIAIVQSTFDVGNIKIKTTCLDLSCSISLKSIKSNYMPYIQASTAIAKREIPVQIAKADNAF